MPAARVAAAVDKGGLPVVLVVDDDPGMRLVCRVNLELEGYRIAEAGAPEDAIGVLHEERVDLVLLDGKLVRAGDGDELGRRIAIEWPHVPVVRMSGTARPDGATSAQASLTKPFDMSDLVNAVKSALAEPSER